MSNQATNLTQKLWDYCDILRDDGMSYSDYIEQLTYLLFLKMAEEHSKPPFLHLQPLDEGYSWANLVSTDGESQLNLYEGILRRLGLRTDLFGTIYKNALSKFRDPGKFQLVVKEINSLEWSDFDSDVKGAVYEGLLEKTASEGKAGAGQYFTPRPLVDAITDVIRPLPDESVYDPACGTGGFLLSAFHHVAAYGLNRKQEEHLKHEALHGVELVDSVARLCLMNLVLHGIGGQVSPIIVGDSLALKPKSASDHFDIVLANPPFGKWSSITFDNGSGGKQKSSHVFDRDDFWATTSNKQFNFLQHIFTVLKQTGRAAVVLPDNVLFEGGAGETIRRTLLKQADVHTLLRLPTGIFYAQGVKANVLFFDRKPERETPWTEKLWIYDLRTNKHFTLKNRALRRRDLSEFVACYHAENRHAREENERFKSFSYDELINRDKASLDIFWLKDESLEESANLPEPGVLALEITEDLEAALQQFAAIAEELKV